MRWVNYEAWHLAECPARPNDIAQTFGHLRVWTWMDEEASLPLAIIGVTIMWPGVAYAWARVSDGVRGRGLAFTRAMRRLIVEQETILRLRQIRTSVRADAAEYRAWIKLLGFKEESVMVGAAPDRGDIVTYLREPWAQPKNSRLHRLITSSCGSTTAAGNRA